MKKLTMLFCFAMFGFLITGCVKQPVKVVDLDEGRFDKYYTSVKQYSDLGIENFCKSSGATKLPTGFEIITSDMVEALSYEGVTLSDYSIFYLTDRTFSDTYMLLVLNFTSFDSAFKYKITDFGGDRFEVTKLDSN